MPDQFSTSSDWESLSLFNSTGITLEANVQESCLVELGIVLCWARWLTPLLFQGADKTLFQGVFADDLSVAVSCTGTGETFMRAGVARRAAYMVRIWYGDGGLFDMVTQETRHESWRISHYAEARREQLTSYIGMISDQWSQETSFTSS